MGESDKESVTGTARGPPSRGRQRAGPGRLFAFAREEVTRPAWEPSASNDPGQPGRTANRRGGIPQPNGD